MNKRLNTIIFFSMALVASVLIWSTWGHAQPMTAPKPVSMVAPKPTAKPAVKVPVMAPAAKPADMATVITADKKLATMETVKPEAKLEAKVEQGMSATDLVDLIFKILGGIATLLFTVLGGLGYMKWAKNDRWKKIQKYIDMAFPAVEALAKKTENKVDDKLVEFLKMINESLRKAGEAELNEPEIAAAKDEAEKKALAEKLKG